MKACLGNRNCITNYLSTESCPECKTGTKHSFSLDSTGWSRISGRITQCPAVVGHAAVCSVSPAPLEQCMSSSTLDPPREPLLSPWPLPRDSIRRQEDGRNIHAFLHPPREARLALGCRRKQRWLWTLAADLGTGGCVHHLDFHPLISKGKHGTRHARGTINSLLKKGLAVPQGRGCKSRCFPDPVVRKLARWAVQVTFCTWTAVAVASTFLGRRGK